MRWPLLNLCLSKLGRDYAGTGAWPWRRQRSTPHASPRGGERREEERRSSRSRSFGGLAVSSILSARAPGRGGGGVAETTVERRGIPVVVIGKKTMLTNGSRRSVRGREGSGRVLAGPGGWGWPSGVGEGERRECARTGPVTAQAGR